METKLVIKNNLKFLVREGQEDEGIINEILKSDIYFLSKIIGELSTYKENPVIIDIGAHIGSFSIYFSNKLKNSHIYSYEPFKESFKIFRKNLSLNKIKNIKAFNCAVWKNKEKKKLNLGRYPSLHSFYVKSSKSIDVETTTLNEILIKNQIQKCHLLKIDAEGSEYSILSGISKKNIEKIERVIIEYHNFLIRGDLIRLSVFLTRNNYKIKIIPITSKDYGIIHAIKNRKNVLLPNIFEIAKSRVFYYLSRYGFLR